MMIEYPFETPVKEERSDTSTHDYSPRLGDRVAFGLCSNIRRVSENNFGQLLYPSNE